MRSDVHRLLNAEGTTVDVRVDIFPMDACEAIDVYGLPRDLYPDGGWRVEGFIDGRPAGTRFYSGGLGSAYYGQADTEEAARAFLKLSVNPDPATRVPDQDRPCDVLSDPAGWYRQGDEPAGPVDIYWIDDNDGRGPVKLSRPVRCF